MTADSDAITGAGGQVSSSAGKQLAEAMVSALRADIALVFAGYGAITRDPTTYVLLDPATLAALAHVAATAVLTELTAREATALLADTSDHTLAPAELARRSDVVLLYQDAVTELHRAAATRPGQLAT